ncbi:hypothetical protein [Actinosynnema pretiosum]|uniref:Uncharacterized protein n=1 Tax=Actinosynnema pretiosum TaxID=42197 RepID=A0A290Z8U1_9PSEU|nr:hypothetical protein [Actinosynnema pretiosum]ATE55404.1 hypothetical protein CNX65_20700 [Actinosynnema pretiosum]
MVQRRLVTSSLLLVVIALEQRIRTIWTFRIVAGIATLALTAAVLLLATACGTGQAATPGPSGAPRQPGDAKALFDRWNDSLVAVVLSGLYDSAVTAGGRPDTAQARMTFERRDGRWTIVEHHPSRKP